LILLLLALLVVGALAATEFKSALPRGGIGTSDLGGHLSTSFARLSDAGGFLWQRGIRDGKEEGGCCRYWIIFSPGEIILSKTFLSLQFDRVLNATLIIEKMIINTLFSMSSILIALLASSILLG